MKKILLIIIAALAVMSVSAQDGERINKGDAVPEFAINMIDGTTVNMSDLSGKVVLLNFWATWCPPCRAKLAVVQEELIDKVGNDDFIFLAISRGEELGKVLKFREQHGYEFPMAIDPETVIFPLFAESGIPRQYLVDKEGVVRKVEIGFAYTEDGNVFAETLDLVDELLKK